MYICAMALILLLLLGMTGCSGGKDQNGTVIPGTVTSGAGVITPSGAATDATVTPSSALSPTEGPDLSNRIVWEVPFFNAPTEEGRAEIKRLLKEKGINCEIDFVNMDVMTDQEYDTWLNKLAAKGQEPDIVNTGNWYTQHGAETMAETYCLQLDEYLASAEGTELAKAFSEFEWSRSRVNGKAYVVPRMYDPESGEHGMYLRVKDGDAARFDVWDGTYGELLRICGEANGVPAIPYLRWTIVSALAGYASYDGIPYDPKTGEAILWTEDEKLLNLWNTLYRDIREGKVVDLSVSGISQPDNTGDTAGGVDYFPMNANVVAEIYFGLREKQEGYTDICIIADAGEPVINGAYGIYRGSSKTELALRVLSACMADPQIVALLNPRFGTAEAVECYRAALAERSTGITAGFIPELTLAQWTIYRELKNGMYAVENACYTADLSGQYLAGEFDAASLGEAFLDDKYGNLIGVLSEQLQALGSAKSE